MPTYGPHLLAFFGSVWKALILVQLLQPVRVGHPFYKQKLTGRNFQVLEKPSQPSSSCTKAADTVMDFGLRKDTGLPTEREGMYFQSCVWLKESIRPPQQLPFSKGKPQEIFRHGAFARKSWNLLEANG